MMFAKPTNICGSPMASGLGFFSKMPWRCHPSEKGLPYGPYHLQERVLLQGPLSFLPLRLFFLFQRLWAPEDGKDGREHGKKYNSEEKPL